MIDLVKDSASTLNELTEKLNIFFTYYPTQIETDNKLFSEKIYSFLNIISVTLKESKSITAEKFKTLLNDVKSNENISGNIWKPIRIAITSIEHGPDIGKVVEILGCNDVHKRINTFLKINGH